MNIVPENQAVSYSVYKQAVCTALPVSSAFIEAQIPRITRGFDNGESVAMMVEELKIVWEVTRGQWQKTPRQLAARVVR